jgi:hypothetical protein
LLSLKFKNARGASAIGLILAMFFALLNPTPASAADIAFSVAGTPSISGYNQVGNTLTAYTGSWSPSPTTFTYQWRRDGMDINFANSSTYVVTGDDYNRNISVAVTASRTGYITTTRISGNFTIYYKGDLANTPNPTINGTMMVGEYLYAVPGTYSTPVNMTYQWQANYVNISNATSDSYQLQPADKNKTITLRITVTKPGFNDLVKTVNGSEYVKPATPTFLWQYNYGVFTGKNTIKANAKYSFGGTDRIKTWCIKRDGVALNLDVSTKGVYFTDNSNRILNAVKGNSGCYTSYTDDLLNLGIRVDVTSWTLGTHTLEATVEDVMGVISKPLTMNITVGKTAPTVNGNFTTLNTPVKDTFTISASTSTHAVEAPIKRWCMTIDGIAVNNYSGASFQSGSGIIQDKNSLVQSQGCVSSSNPDAILTQGELIVDSKQFSNGSHELGLKVMSQDSEGTTWWSDTVKTTFKIKNAYVPKVSWSSSVTKPVAKGTANRISGSISANIPGTAGRVTLSAQNANGDWEEFFSEESTNSFSGSARFAKNTEVQIEIFDEDNLSVLTQSIEVRVAPVVKLAKPKVVLTGSTISDKITKTVTLTATSPGLNAPCSAKWSGGSASFSMKGGKGSLSFRPRGSGTVSVTCSASEMAPSAAVSAKY